ncbi:MAG: T9SS type A sorting domain-containing protein, partial [Candidatus Cloacimonetes bacterium]|nr:T9SS type A sorting domain-containing protein [Candidatus Cloacimonadota bacterium]
ESYKAIFNEGITNIGYITNYANVFVINLHGGIGIQNVLTYLWLGDSSIEPWTLQIEELNVTHDGQLFLGMSTFDVTVMGTSGPIENARVCVSNDDSSIYGVAFTDASGIAQVQFDGAVQNPGTAYVSAQSHNYLRYQQDIPVIPQTGPYCIYAGNSINDASGNGNGELDYGESVLMTLDIENVGVQQADNVTVEISTADTYITITDGTEVYGDIAANTVVSVTDGFAFDVAGDVPDGHYVAFDVAAISGATTWNSSFSIEVHAPAIGYLEFLVNDTASGNGDYMWDPGETVDIFVTLNNSGSADAFNVEGILSINDPFVTLNTTTTQSFGDITAGGDADAVFNATSDVNTPEAHLAEFIIDFTADLGITGSGSFATQIGGYLIEEYFDSTTYPPDDWSIIGANPGNWSSSSSSNAGGNSPESEFGWSPSFVDFSALTSPVINTTGSASLLLTYKHFLNDYSGNSYSIGVKTTSDGGTNWNTVYEVFPTGDIGPETLELTVETPDVGSSTFQIAFFFDGNSYNLNYYYIDDIILGGGTTAILGTVSGIVTDIETSLPIEGADIAGMATSGADGSYSFDISIGTYDFTCIADNYFDLEITSVVVEEGVTTDLDFAMNPSYPPENVDAVIVDFNDVVISWEAPADPQSDIITEDKTSKVVAGEREGTPVVSLSNEVPVSDTRSLTGFKVYEGGNEIVEITDPSTLTYTDEAIDAGDYVYTVTAIYDDGESNPSDPANVTVLLPAPTDVTAASQDPDVIMSWVEPTRGIVSYNVYRDTELIAEDVMSSPYVDLNVPSGNYTYNVTTIYDGDWESEMSNGAFVAHTDVDNLLKPEVTELTGNYPNPFNPTTTISFSTNEAGYVSINIYNMKGQLVKTLVNEYLDSAFHNVSWNGKDNSSKTVSSGIYFYKMKSSSYTSTKKMILMK